MLKSRKYGKKSVFGKITLIALCALILLSSLPLSGCQVGGGGKIKLTMIESLTNPQRTKIIREIADEFQKLHANITIEIISPPLDGADQKIQQMLVNKNDLDILEVRDNTVAQFSSNDLLEPMDEYIKSWADFGTLVENAKITATLVGDKYFLIPYGFYQRMLYYRKDWLEAAGIPVPKTVSELYEAAKKLTDPANGRYGFTLRGVSGGYGQVTNYIQARVGQNDLDLRDPGYDKGGKSIYNNPYAVEAYQFMKKMYDDACPKDAIAWGFQDQCQAFISGVTAFLYQDPEVVAICREDMADGTWDTAPLPVDDVSQQYPISVGYAGWGIPAHSKHKKEAADFIMFLSNPDNNVKFCLDYSVIPIHSNAAEKSDFFRSGPFSPYVEMNNRPQNYFLIVGKNREADKSIDENRNKEYSQALSGEAAIPDMVVRWAQEYDSGY
jgi:multiple sugar transport system substrate-binding protein